MVYIYLNQTLCPNYKLGLDFYFKIRRRLFTMQWFYLIFFLLNRPCFILLYKVVRFFCLKLQISITTKRNFKEALHPPGKVLGYISSPFTHLPSQCPKLKGAQALVINKIVKQFFTFISIVKVIKLFLCSNKMYLMRTNCI